MAHRRFIVRLQSLTDGKAREDGDVASRGGGTIAVGPEPLRVGARGALRYAVRGAIR